MGAVDFAAGATVASGATDRGAALGVALLEASTDATPAESPALPAAVFELMPAGAPHFVQNLLPDRGVPQLVQ
ncbi:MAG: hypothetical protein ACRD4V_10185 [Candidatus Acidiferrales bacterium]